MIAIPDVKRTEKVVAVGNRHGSEVSKIETIGLTPMRAECVAAPLIRPVFHARPFNCAVKTVPHYGNELHPFASEPSHNIRSWTHLRIDANQRSG